MIHDAKWIGRGQLEDDPSRWETLRYTSCDRIGPTIIAGRVSVCGVSMRHNEDRIGQTIIATLGLKRVG